MIRSIEDIEHFDKKVTKLFKAAQYSRSGLFDMNSTGKEIGLNSTEIEAMYYHLSRNSMIEITKNSLCRISKYGRMIQNGQITNGYVPI